MSELVLMRAASGASIGMGHAVRTLAVAHEVRALGAWPVLVLDDAETAGRFATQGFDTRLASMRPDWVQLRAASAWFDGFWDWSEDMQLVRANGTPCVLVENRTPARELARLLVYPALHWTPDEWDQRNEERVVAGARWIPLAPDVLGALAVARPEVPTADLLVTFGGSDPLRSTERVLRLLPTRVGRVVVSVGVHMRARLPEIRRASAHLRGVRILPVGSRLGAWMARSRRAITAVGTSLYELAYLRVPALILANYDHDERVFAHYQEHGPHRPLGVAPRMDDGELRARLAVELDRAYEPPAPIPGLGEGAAALARRLVSQDVTQEVAP